MSAGGSENTASRRSIVPLVAGLTLTGVATLIVLGLIGSARGAQPEASAPSGPRETAQVERRDLEERERLPGTLGYGEEQTVSGRLSGTVTALAPEGSTVERGQPLAIVDRQRISLLYGTTPAWRDMAVGVADGEDVRQLEDNLAALGYDPGTVDAHFSAATREAVEDWQEDMGVTEDGSVGLGEVVFLPGPVRVGSHQVQVGAAVGGEPLMAVTGTERLVMLDVEADDRALFTVGASVAVELPGEATTTGTVRDVGRVGQSDPDDPEAEATFTVVVALDDPAAAGDLEEAPVSVEVTRETARGVLAVPVRALVALAEGGYAVEIVDGVSTRLVAVESGAFADGWVEVRGDSAEGDKGVVAS